jgi:hypothetical protein
MIVVQTAEQQPQATYLWELAAVAGENSAGQLVRLDRVDDAKAELHKAMAARNRLADADELEDFAAGQLAAMKARWSMLLGRQ